MADDHEHKYELKLAVEEIDDDEFHIYAECKCGAELDRDEIEHRLNTWEEVNYDAKR